MFKIYNYWRPLTLLLAIVSILAEVAAHDAKDFDDSILYKIDFELINLDPHPELKPHVKSFSTHEGEKYDCLIPQLEDLKDEQPLDPSLDSPYKFLQTIFMTHSCSYRIEAYWSYEICHGHHVRQYHEEREGKNVKFQEYYLGKLTEDKTKELAKIFEQNQKAGIKYKTTKIDSTKYPYIEIEMSDGTPCDIINAPRTTTVRYVCYPHGKNEIYSFKETSSCNYEAIILTSVLCMIPTFYPVESKEVSIKCFNSQVEKRSEVHKPLSMLRNELNEMQVSDDIPISKEGKTAAAGLAITAGTGDRYMLLDKFVGDIDKLVVELMASASVEFDTTAAQLHNNPMNTAGGLKVTARRITDMTPIKEFISGKNCLTGGTGWWKYEFCYGRHVRQFHKDKKSETELYLGYFVESSHRQWITANPEKAARRPGNSASLWHHYERGTHCDRTGVPREVDVKLTCVPIVTSAASVSMYLLEPKTCQYILVVESPIICDLMLLADEHGLVEEQKLQLLLEQQTETDASSNNVDSNEVSETKEKSNSAIGTSTVLDAIPTEDVRA